MHRSTIEPRLALVSASIASQCRRSPFHLFWQTKLLLRVCRLGNIETRPSFHDDTHIWPVGYRVRQQMKWHTMMYINSPMVKRCLSPEACPSRYWLQII